MFALMLQVLGTRTHFGFGGLEGVLGIIVGVIVMILICVVLFKLVPLIAAKCGADETTQQIIYWLLVLCVLLIFLHFFGLY
jgi:hypothetical protein